MKKLTFLASLLFSILNSFGFETSCGLELKVEEKINRSLYNYYGTKPSLKDLGIQKKETKYFPLKLECTSSQSQESSDLIKDLTCSDSGKIVRAEIQISNADSPHLISLKIKNTTNEKWFFELQDGEHSDLETNCSNSFYRCEDQYFANDSKVKVFKSNIVTKNTSTQLKSFDVYETEELYLQEVVLKCPTSSIFEQRELSLK